MVYLLQGPQPFKVGLTTVPTIFNTFTINTIASTVYNINPTNVLMVVMDVSIIVYLQASDFKNNPVTPQSLILVSLISRVKIGSLLLSTGACCFFFCLSYRIRTCAFSIRSGAVLMLLQSRLITQPNILVVFTHPFRANKTTKRKLKILKFIKLKCKDSIKILNMTYSSTNTIRNQIMYSFPKF